MNSDFRISVSATQNPKLLKLMRRCGDRAFYNIVCLWTYTAQDKPDGVLDGDDAESVELAAGWLGEPGLFYQTLVDLRLLDVDEDGVISVHDWRNNNGYAAFAEARSEKAKKAASARWGKNAPSMDEQMLDDAPSNAPSMNEQMLDSEQADAPSPTPTPTPAPYSGTDGAERSQANPPAPAAPPEPYGIDIPLVDGTSYAVTTDDVTQWEDAYPGVDVPAELKRIRSWADSTPKKRKTRNGIRKHINGWLAREQDKCGRNDRASPNRPAYGRGNGGGKTIGGLTF